MLPHISHWCPGFCGVLVPIVKGGISTFPSTAENTALFASEKITKPTNQYLVMMISLTVRNAFSTFSSILEATVIKVVDNFK